MPTRLPGSPGDILLARPQLALPPIEGQQGSGEGRRLPALDHHTRPSHLPRQISGCLLRAGVDPATLTVRAD